MRKKILYYYNELEYWHSSFLYSILIILLWWVLGEIFKLSFFDGIFFSFAKVLDKDDVFGYLQVLLTIQIPLFLMFLGRMVEAGYINRKVLPQVTGFRTILVVMMVSTTLLLISPQESYLYFPTLIMCALSFRGLYQAIMVIFQPESYQAKIKRHLEKRIHKSFKRLLNIRAELNNFSGQFKNYTNIEMNMFSRDVPKDMEHIEIRASQDGYLSNIDLRFISKVLTKEFNAAKGIDFTKDQQKESQPGVGIAVFPASRIKRGRVMAQLIVPHGYARVGVLSRQIAKTFSIVKDAHVDIKWFDELINEFDEQLNLAITQKKTSLLGQTFDLLQLLFDQIDNFVERQIDSNYTLEYALKETHQLFGDELSRRLKRLHEMLSDVIDRAFREDQQDVNRELVRFVDNNAYNAMHTKFVTSIARYDQLFEYAVRQFVYANSWNQKLSTSQVELRDSLISKFRQHTSLLNFELRDEYEKGDDTDTLVESIASQWFRHRLDSLRWLSMAALSNKQDSAFEKLIEIIDDADNERRSGEISPKLTSLARCNLLMIAAYMCHKDEFRSRGGELLKIINRWGDNDLTKVLLECYNNNYADAWRIDSYDFKPDGRIQSVPNYRDVLRRLWVELMLQSAPVLNTDYYGEKTLFESTDFFAGSYDTGDDDTPLGFLAKSKEPNAPELADLVKKFIGLRRDWEKSKLAAEKLEPSKVAEFGEILLEAYRSNSIAERVFPNIVSVNKPTSRYMQTGTNQILDKAAFIKEWHVGVSTRSMAGQLGQGMASNQDRHIFSTLFKNKVKHTAFEDLLKDLRQEKNVEWLVVANGVGQWQIENLLGKFLDNKKSTQRDQYFKGIRQPLSIQQLIVDSLPYGIFFVAQRDVGTLNAVLSKSGEPIKIDVEGFAQSKILMKDILKQAPDWLTKKGTLAEQKVFLGTKVRLLVERIFKYTPPESSRVLYFGINDDIL